MRYANRVLTLLICLWGCQEESGGDSANQNDSATAAQGREHGENANAPGRGDGPWTAHVANLSPINPELTDSKARGKATLLLRGDTLKIVVDAYGLPSEQPILQHFHGFENGDQDASCPGPGADGNGDGLIDLLETRDDAGVTMVPFTDDPAAMKIEAGEYPKSDSKGELHYEKTVDLGDLRNAFAERFGGQKLRLDQRVVFLHGAPAEVQLPDTAQSLEGVPARVTVPIACGELAQDLNPDRP